jgi:small GTP-binding protein
MEEEEYNMMFKMVIVGDSGVGKTNILLRYLKNEFNEQTKSTIGVEFGTKKIVIDNIKIKIQIWDTAGQERYKAITSAYYKGAHGALIVYDLTRKETYNNVEKWLSNLKNNGDEKMAVMILGNKSDEVDKRVVTTEQGQDKAQRSGVPFFETSALTAENISQAFDEIFYKMYNIYKQEQQGDEGDNGLKQNTVEIKMDGGKDLLNKKRKCC